ncbi:MAG: DNA gyrase inhibitor YacG [Tistlia sp.]|uniref:DNA gyrase inhibitor YacG n=1 Tax=Tistlia sp. TaxID=3057121 RepID=UPI0034A4E27D
MDEDDRVIPFPRRSRRVKAKGCPICGKPAEAAYEPFCSPRCKQVDLGRWLNGTYRVETDERPGEPGAAAEDDERSDG